MPIRLFSHVRRNAIAYVALFFAIGGGGAGAAIVASTQTANAVHACVNKRTGALFVVKRCTSAERALTFDKQGPAGGPNAAAWAQVESNGSVGAASGLTVVQQSPGHFLFTVTAAGCKKSNDQVPIASPTSFGLFPPGSAISGQTYSEVVAAATGRKTFSVITGYVDNGQFTANDEPFDVLDECGVSPYS